MARHLATVPVGWVVLCAKCAGSGFKRNSGETCDLCDGTGWIDWTDLLTPMAVILLVAGIALTLGKWLWHLFAK
jgi:hypothetical protein